MAPTASANETSGEQAWLACGLAPFAGKYKVERVLGQGGMGTVFEARHVRLGQRVAIKVLGSGLRNYPELVQRFEREARAAGSLTSGHAVRVFDIDATEDGTPFIVMELLSGRDLADIVDRDGPQPVSRAVRWIIEACEAIDEAHSLGIIHRDIKPSNLFLADDGYRTAVKVLDFGIAKRVAACEVAITQAVAPLGTPHYMSPEQVRCAKDVDARTDVWSLGVTLYEMICGQPPFPHESSSACIAAIAADPVPDPRTHRPDLGDDFAAVLLRALEKDAADRYQSVTELVEALAPFAEPEDDVARSRPTSQAPSQSSIPIVLELRPPMRSRHPTVDTISATRVKRVRTAFGAVSAAVLGFAVLVATPKCVSTGNDATASTLASTSTAAAPVAPPPAAPVAAPVVIEEPAAPAAPPARTVAAAPVRAPAPSTTTAKRALVQAVVQAEKARPQAAIRNGAHGGLSGPGF